MIILLLFILLPSDENMQTSAYIPLGLEIKISFDLKYSVLLLSGGNRDTYSVSSISHLSMAAVAKALPQSLHLLGIISPAF
jgi:hypothetical protein